MLGLECCWRVGWEISSVFWMISCCNVGVVGDNIGCGGLSDSEL